MKRRAVLYLLLLSFIPVAFASDLDHQTLDITFSAGETIFAGFAKRDVDDLLPVDPEDLYDAGEAIYFEYDDNTDSYVTDTFYAYAQIFTNSNVEITLIAGPLIGGSNSVDWTNIANATDTIPGGFAPDTPGVYTETSGAGNGRSRCFDIRLSIPVSSVVNRNVDYSTTMRLKVETI